ncbi:CO/xanthine dehydrogenase Mo-binding subunit [Rhodoligotrophos appendicifer]
MGTERPVKLLWTREDDIKGGYYRPASLHRVTAALDRNGDLLSWQQRIVRQGVADMPPNRNRDEQTTEAQGEPAFTELPYDLSDVRIELQQPQSKVPVGLWRSSAHADMAYVVETFIDDLAYTADIDPVSYRRRMMGSDPRYEGVLDRVVEAAGWHGSQQGSAFRGVALHRTRGTYVAMIAEIVFPSETRFTVRKVWCAVDCGIVINPQLVRSQIEGGLGFGLGAALRERVTFVHGRVLQSNFHDYQPLKMSEMPEVEVHLVDSEAAPTGVGEAGVPPIAPAVANAIFAGTGIRIRQLPFSSTRLIRR